jgi:hypothetical protein
LPLKKFIVLLFTLLGALFGSALPAEELNVYFKTSPRLQLLRPFASPVDLSLLVTGADGKPVEHGSVAIRLDAPSPGFFFSTDYPLVEGTVLSELRLPLRQGKASWKYLFPIRGEYRLTVDARSADGRKAGRTYTFAVRENPKKWLALGAFSAGLFVLGVIAGRIFTGARANAVVLIAAATLWAATSETSAALPPAASGSAVLTIEPATVGRPVEVRWSLARHRGAGDGSALLSLTITHLEKDKVVFAVETVPMDGEWSMKFHFPDGAEYRVTAVGSVPGRAPVRTEQIVSVTGVEPPAAAMLQALAYFVALIALGLAAGRWSKRRSPRLIRSRARGDEQSPLAN